MSFSMRIGVIGVTGFIGGALAREAAQRGHEVIAFTRRPGAAVASAGEVRCLGTDGTAMDFSGLETLVNLAGESIFGLWTKARRKRIRESRIELTHRIVDALARGRERPRSIVSASAVGFYGGRADEILTEESSPGSGFLAELCVDWEAAANRASALGMRVVNLRTSMVLGKGGGGWSVLRRIFGLGLGGRLGSGKQWMPWIHLDDEVGIILHAIENESCFGPMNLAAPNPVTNAEFTKAVARAVHRPAFCHAPAIAMRLALGEFSHVLLDSERAAPRAALNAGYRFRHASLDEALASLTR
ncbi:MAG TPA: TIGR01777 family oxidoreductase [Verrucomicrobiaceae bacterium]